MASIASIVTRGFGTPGSAPLVKTRGYAQVAAPPPPPPVVRHHPMLGFP